MDLLGMLILTISLVILVVSWWAAVCSTLTYRDRMKMIRDVDLDDPNWDKRFEEMERVSFHDHYFKRLFFQDPRKLYRYH